MQEKKDKDYYEEGFGDSMTEGESKSLQDDTGALSEATPWRIEPKKKKQAAPSNAESEKKEESAPEGEGVAKEGEGVSPAEEGAPTAAGEKVAEVSLPPAPAPKGSPFFGFLAILSIILGGFTAYILWTMAGAGQVPPFVASIASAIVK